jgi:2-methylisocitrate lyase-like PEP mutase family enzyme
MAYSFSDQLRQQLHQESIIAFMGIYDAFSAVIAGQHYQHLFVSGYGFAASHYGLPDIGFIAWPDMIAFVQRLRSILPQHLLLVDIDDGYVDVQVACHVVRQLEACGAAGVILEDQQRPRRCGHVAGKQLLEPAAYLEKLEKVLASRDRLFVIARTDASDLDEILERAVAYAAAGADAILADGITDLNILRMLKQRINVPLVFNQIAGGKSPAASLTELQAAGVSLVNYSTPCLFAAQTAIETALQQLQQADGKLSDQGLAASNQLLQQSLDRSVSIATSDLIF